MKSAVLLFLLSGPAFIHAETVAQGSAGEFTVAGYVRRVLELSPDVLQIRQILEQARALWKSQLGAAILPTLSFSAVDYVYGHNPSNNYAFQHWRASKHDTSFNTSANLNLFNNFQDYLKVRSASAAKESAFENLQTANQRLAFAAIQTYFDLSLRQHLTEVARQNLKAQQDQYDLSQDLYKHGMKSLSDLLKSETDLRSSEERIVAAEADEKSALMQFNLLLNRPGWTESRLQTDLEPGSTVVPDLSSSLERARTQRPELLKARADLDRSGIGFEQAMQSNLPSLSANAAWSKQDLASFGLPASDFGIPNPNYQAGVTLSLPFGFNLYSQVENTAAALAEKRRARGALDSVARQIQQDVYASLIALDRAAKIYRIAVQKESIADRNLDLVTEQYRQGSADVIRLAQAQLDYLQARTERAQALHDAFINRAQYKQAVGERLW